MALPAQLWAWTESIYRNAATPLSLVAIGFTYFNRQDARERESRLRAQEEGKQAVYAMRLHRPLRTLVRDLGRQLELCYEWTWSKALHRRKPGDLLLKFGLAEISSELDIAPWNDHALLDRHVFLTLERLRDAAQEIEEWNLIQLDNAGGFGDRYRFRRKRLEPDYPDIELPPGLFLPNRVEKLERILAHARELSELLSRYQSDLSLPEVRTFDRSRLMGWTA